MSETEEWRERIAELRQIAEQTADADFREKAAQCRRLAENILGDPAAEALIRLAEEFEAKAAASARANRATLAIGLCERAARARPSNAIQGV